MRPSILVFDDFLEFPAMTRARLTSKEFTDLKSPVDGVVYPDICTDLPNDLQAEIVEGLSELMRKPVIPAFIFARLTRLGKTAPNKIHADDMMGEYAAHVYLSKHWPVGSGTSFWMHRKYGAHHTPENSAACHASTNDPTVWNRLSMVQGDYNRVVIHDATLWHCAEPVGGWGDSPESGRLVITCFFNLGSHAPSLTL